MFPMRCKPPTDTFPQYEVYQPSLYLRCYGMGQEDRLSLQFVSQRNLCRDCVRRWWQDAVLTILFDVRRLESSSCFRVGLFNTVHMLGPKAQGSEGQMRDSKCIP